MKFIKAFITAAIAASYLLAIDPVTSLSISAPHNGGSKYNSAITFTWIAPSGVDSYIYVLDTNSSTIPSLSSSAVTISSSSATSLSKLPTVSGNYYLHIQAVDSSNAKSTTVHTQTPVSIDIDKGTVTMSPNGGSLSSVANLTLSGSEAGNIYYTTDGSTPTTSSSLYSTPLSIITAKTLKAILVDTAGNVGDVVAKAFTSTIQPTVKTTQDGNSTEGATFATKSTNLVATVQANTSITVGGGTTAEGFTRYQYKKSTDNTYTTVSNISTPIDISGLDSRSYTYYILGGDAYNYKDESDRLKVSFSVDNDAPTSLTLKYDNNATLTRVNPALSTSAASIMSLSPSNSSEMRYIIQASAPSTYAGYSSIYSAPFALTNSVADGTTGSVTIHYAAKDASGNWAKASKTYTIDKKDPVITMPAEKTFAASFSATISFDDDGNITTADAGTIKYLLESTTNSSCSTKTTAALTKYTSAITIPIGSNQCLYAIAIDEAGNESNSSTSGTTVSATFFTFSNSVTTVSLDLVDTSKFATIATHGATAINDINVTGANFTVYGYSFDGGAETNVTVDTTTLVSGTKITIPASLGDGEHNVTVKAYRTGVLEDSITKTFTIDNTKPTSVTLSDLTFPTATTDVNIKIPSDATSVIYQKNSDENVTISQNTILTLDTNATIKAWSKDSVGNIGDVTTATYTQSLTGIVKTFNGKGWKMITLPTEDVNTSTDSLMTWAYDNNGTWTNNIAGDIYSDVDGNISKGYWVYCTQDTTSVTYSSSDKSSLISTVPSNWSLLGITSTTDISSNTNLIWTYDSGVWKYHTPLGTLDTTLNTLGYTKTTAINAYNAYWIYKLP